MDLPPEPTGGLLGKWRRMLWKAVKARTIIAGDNVRVERTPEGTRIHANRRSAPGAGGGGNLILAEITGGVDDLQDYFLCEVEGVSSLSTKVARPYLHRVSPFNNTTVNGVSYVYTNALLRKATASFVSTGYYEFQKITPDLAVGDLIYVQHEPEGGTGVSGADYIDANLDGRCWAEVFIDE